MAKRIDSEVLNKAMYEFNQKARRENKALGLDDVFVKDNQLIREKADGTTVVLKEVNAPIKVHVKYGFKSGKITKTE